MHEEYISVEEAAALLGVAKVTMWRLIRRYDLQTFRILGERATFVRRADIEPLRQPIPIARGKDLAA